jgi:hypothetical protein
LDSEGKGPVMPHGAVLCGDSIAGI